MTAAMREVVVDTETTGLDCRLHKVVEVGCIELWNRLPTGRWFRAYVNPGMRVTPGAFKVHGIGNDLLDGMPLFQDIEEPLLMFLGHDPIVAHNAPFDLGFLQMELQRALPNRSIDTLALARKRHPGAANSLDALCRRYKIQNTRQGLHGALVDCDLLAQAYLHLTGGKQQAMNVSRPASVTQQRDMAEYLEEIASRPVRPPRPHEPTDEEADAHKLFVAERISGPPVWWGG